ncbi:MAG: YraN family protein [Candidatus Krumholzibacteriales bacterium]
MKGRHIDAGRIGEEIAERYLLLAGYRIVERNYRAGRLEIDLVAERQDCLVFAEVKARRTGAFGSALENLLPAKIENIREAAVSYISENCRSGKPERIRIDLLAIDIDAEKGQMILNHIKGVT